MPDKQPAVPLLYLRNCLLGFVHWVPYDSWAQRIIQDVLAAVVSRRPQAVILDFSMIPLVDSFLSRMVIELHWAVRLLGSQLIIAGLPNEVIMVMVELGVHTFSITTARDVDMALQSLV